jgi:diphthamide biosynthesis protein 7
MLNSHLVPLPDVTNASHPVQHLLMLLQASPAALVSLLQWQAHDLEAWAASTDYWHSSLIYSGGDDCAFKVWDTRQGVDAPAWANRKAHTAGVCCVASSPFQEHLVATGSYDERARLWDLRMPTRPVSLTEVGDAAEQPPVQDGLGNLDRA